MPYPLTVVTAEIDWNRSVRQCGECSACCIVFELPEFDKEAFQLCPQQGPTGCSIHDHRPDRCRKFECLWLAGVLEGDERMRPDQLGLVVYNTRSSAGVHLMACELWEGAADDPRCRYLLDRLTRRLPIALTRYGNIFADWLEVRR